MKNVKLNQKILKIVLSGVLAIVPLFPLQVNADTIDSSNIVGVERTLTNMELVLHDNSNFDKYNFIYNFEVLLDKSYVGWINISVGTQFTYSTKNGNQYVNNTGSFTTPSRTYYVNGNSFNISSSVEINLTPGMTNMDIDPAKAYNPTFTLNSSNVTELASIESLSDVIDILNDINQVVSIDVMGELQNIVTNTGLSSEYLENIQNMSRYNIPLESLQANAWWMNGYYYDNDTIELMDFYEYIYHEYPIYKLNTLTGNYRTLYYNWIQPDETVYIIYISPYLGSSGTYDWQTNLQVYQGDVSIVREQIKAPFNMRLPDATGNSMVAWYCIKFTITSNLDTQQVLRIRWNTAPVYFIPIYIGNDKQTLNIGTEFALNWGLENKFLKAINTIADGTVSSNQSASSTDQANDDLVTSSDSLFQFESTQNQNMNNALNQIDTNYDVGNKFGSKFLASADWVRTQFNVLTGNTPFGSVLSFSLLLGLALLIIGKVNK